MKTHFDAEAPFDSIRMVAETPCGAGKGVSQYGLDATSNPALVDCKRCLKRIEAAEAFAADEKGRASDRAAMARNAGRAVAAHEKAQQDAAASTESNLDDMTAREAAEQRANWHPDFRCSNCGNLCRTQRDLDRHVCSPEKLPHVVAGPASFWDVREAKDWTERQAFTQHNVYLANTMARDRGHASLRPLIEERDTLLYTLGDMPDDRVPSNSGVSQYLRGRIAGIEFALAQFGVKGF